MHTYMGETLHFNLVYKKQKTVRIYIDFYGSVEVHVPKGTTEEGVLRLVEGKWEQILQKKIEMKKRADGKNSKVYDHNETFLYLGESYPIQIFQESDISQDYVVFKDDMLHIHVKQLEDEKIQQALKRFYYQQCKSLVEKSIRFYQNNFKMKPRSIRINDSKTTWGTCDAKQQLTFNWKLAMAPQMVIDYVVVHEMCHMIHLNHDRSFWRLVGKIQPNYEEQEKWLALSSWKMNV
jgi:predicted metal-dependent hydrolase